MRRPNRPVELEELNPVKRYTENQDDVGNIHEDGFETLKRRPRVRYITESVDLDEARSYDSESKGPRLRWDF